jgi:lauroyl/myristoyl acyltransferase
MSAGQRISHKPEPLSLPGKLLRILLTPFLLSAIKLCVWLGPERMGRIGGDPQTARMIGWILRHLLRRRSPLSADANLKLLFPHLSDAERTRIKQDYYRNILSSLAILGGMHANDALFKRIKVSGQEHLQGHDNGMIFVSCHFFDWEIGWLNLFSMGYPPYILYRDFSENLVDYRAINYHNRYPDPDWYIPIWRSGELVEHSRRGKNLFLFLDIRTKQGRNGQFIDFCGHPAWTSIFAASLALEHGKTLIPTYFRRDGQGGYLQCFEAPIDCSSGDPVEITRLINASMARQILAHPEQWALWDSVRWKP